MDISIEESPRLDSDTQGEAGMPEIAATIFDKISNCGIFLADLSFVGKSFDSKGKEPKKLPNANVLLELGYASSRIGWNRVICVMNTFYGPPEETIFDIKHRRFPIAFLLESEKSDEYKAIESKLERELEAAIRASIQSDHQAVEDALRSLDNDCFKIMSDYGSQDLFNLPVPQYQAQHVTTQVYVHAARHMLELGLLETSFDFSKRVVSYTWTYLGKLVLKKLGFRQ